MKLQHDSSSLPLNVTGKSMNPASWLVEAFKATDVITDAKQCACLQTVCLPDTPETSLRLLLMENGTLNVLFFLIFLSTSPCFYLLLQRMFFF